METRCKQATYKQAKSPNHGSKLQRAPVVLVDWGTRQQGEKAEGAPMRRPQLCTLHHANKQAGLPLASLHLPIGDGPSTEVPNCSPKAVLSLSILAHSGQSCFRLPLRRR